MMTQTAASTSGAVDHQLYRFCIEATYDELAKRKHDGDTNQIEGHRTFSGKYGWADDVMIKFTAAVGRRLNASLEAVGRRRVILRTGAGKTIKASTVIDAYVGLIYDQAKAQQ